MDCPPEYESPAYRIYSESSIRAGFYAMPYQFCQKVYERWHKKTGYKSPADCLDFWDKLLTKYGLHNNLKPPIAIRLSAVRHGLGAPSDGPFCPLNADCSARTHCYYCGQPAHEWYLTGSRLPIDAMGTFMGKTVRVEYWDMENRRYRPNRCYALEQFVFTKTKTKKDAKKIGVSAVQREFKDAPPYIQYLDFKARVAQKLANRKSKPGSD